MNGHQKFTTSCLWAYWPCGSIPIHFTLNMKIHQQHLDQMALGYAVTAWLEANSPKKMGLAAKTLGVSARKASAAARYYRIHKNEPQIPELGPCDHDAVCRAGHTVKQIREHLIKKHGALLSTKKRGFCSNPKFHQLARAVGLESFSLHGKPLIHWRHVHETTQGPLSH